MKLYDELKWRGLIKDVAGENLETELNKGQMTFYWGTDPTADSLHIGHYCSLVTAKRLAKAGLKPILLIGGATGMIGDPRPTKEREIIDRAVVMHNFKSIKNQVLKLFDNNVEIVNNYDWLCEMNTLDFLRDVGKYINVNYMLGKDIINRRLETGITFAEFTYTLLQGYDFYHLFKTKGCTLQMEGSDQWGNITTGIELINKKLNKQAYAFTMPLILDSSGKKIGKSEGNALWLDKEKTSSYELYQYFINTSDDKVLEYLKVFTFLSKEEIERIMEKHNKQKENRLAQKTLAKEIITDLHGKEESDKAIRISENLFSGNIQKLTKEEILLGFKGVPLFICKEENIIDFLTNNFVATSKREAREFVTAGAISINGKKITDLNYQIKKVDAIDKEILVVKKGKKKYFIGKFS